MPRNTKPMKDLIVPKPTPPAQPLPQNHHSEHLS